MKNCFIVDSSANIKNGTINDVFVVPMVITKQVGNNSITLKDGVDINPERMLNDMKNGIVYKTASPIMGDCASLLDDKTKEYDNVYILSLPKSISGTFNQWKLLASDYENVHVYDLPGIGPITKWIIDDLKTIDNLTPDVVNNYFETMYKKYHICVIVNDLKYLARGGRISSMKAFLAKLLKIKLVVELTPNGLKPAGKANSNEKIAQVAKNAGNKAIGAVDTNYEKISFLTSGVEDSNFDISKLVEDTKEIFKKTDVTIENGFLPCIISAHVGPNYLAIAIKIK